MNKKLKGFSKLPDSPGIYLFKDRAGKILYIGKATSLRDRVRSYTRGDLLLTRGPLLEKMADIFDRVDFKATNSVLEALILEAAFIKKHQPPYNTQEKDDKSFNFLVITDEKFPRVLIRRGRELASATSAAQTGVGEKNAQDGIVYRSIFGPFPQGRSLKEALRIVRKIFPYRDTCQPFVETAGTKPPRACFNRQIGLCPGVCTGEITSAEYMRIIRRIELFFEGKTDLLAQNIEKEMKSAAKKREFEEAAALRGTLFALRHIHDVTLIGDDIRRSGSVGRPINVGEGAARGGEDGKNFRIEAYDIAHIGGKSTVGVMVVLENDEIERALGRRFKIRGMHGAPSKVKNDDIGNLSEILERRFNHPEWQFPDIIVIDGGETHRNAAEKVLKNRGFHGVVVSVVKDEKHKPREILSNVKNAKDTEIAQKYESQILLANNEAHRAAMSYHKVRRNKDFGSLR